MAAHENPDLSPCQIEAPARARMSHRFFLSDPVRALCGAVVPDSKSVPGMADCVVCMEVDRECEKYERTGACPRCGGRTFMTRTGCGRCRWPREALGS
jgi:hypothetical protein